MAMELPPSIINAQVLVDISLKVLLQKETWGYAKFIYKKRS
jgi:hypothetical protein